MAEILDFDDYKKGSSVIIITNAGIYCGNFSGYTSIDKERAVMVENCKFYSQQQNFELTSSVILLRQVVSLTLGTIQ